MAVKLSDEQIKAADARHKDLLVSAAAGAGKTQVLVARILSLITDKNDPVDIDRILVVTFTTAAAGEMRERIADRLSEMLKGDPGNERLIRQSILLHNADISTIDSFCAKVIRNYFQMVDLDPVFRVGEEGELKLLMSDCMDELFEEEYQLGGEPFYDLRETYFSDDDSMKKAITQIYRMAEAMPWPDEWLEGWASRLHDEAFDDETEKELVYLRPYGDELAELVRKFSARFSAAKREKGLVDFSDLEHFTLRVLLEKDADGNITRTGAAKELAEHYKEIMTDEYQDSNDVQELILSAVSRDHDRFMVGDVKQSIYGFRNADPSIFIKKYDTFGSDEFSEKIDLHKNYRSRESVVNSINSVFERLMTKETGGISYDSSAALVFQAEYPEEKDGSYSTEIMLMDKKDPGFAGAEKEDVLCAEALMAAHRILEIEGNLDVYDSAAKTSRKARFGDIAVIMRNTDDCDRFRKVFQDQGIPARTAARKGYFSSTEVITALDYLRILDNPLQDIPFAGVCHSPIGGFSNEDMAKVRIQSPGTSWYAACRDYSENGPDPDLKERMQSFMAMFDTLRSSVAGNPVHRVIENILELTDYRIFAAGMPAGQKRSANLDFLVQKAKDFEGTSYHGLFNFVRYIEKLEKQEEDYGEADTAKEDEGSVRIMTIHKSKGLEFPVVFLCCAAKPFSKKPIQSTVLLHKDTGPGLTVIDRRRRKKKKTSLYREYVKERILFDQYTEEMRLLYVAMTRAREKLVITGLSDDLGKSAEKCISLGRSCGGTLDKAAVMNCGSFAEWLTASLCVTSCTDPLCSLVSADKGEGECSCMKMSVETPGLSAQKAGEEKTKRAVKISELFSGEPDVKTEDLLSEINAFEYGRSELSSIPEKLSVSELKIMREDDEADEKLYKEETVIPYIPAFIGKKEEEEKITGAARGTIYHFVLEQLDYGGFADKKDESEYEKEVSDQLDRLVRSGRLSGKEAKAVRIKDITAFLLSPLGRRMAAADLRKELKREQPFTCSIPASDVNKEWGSGDSILVQGVIDAYFYENGNIIIVDYKTDYLTDPEGSELLDKYSKQLYYYKAALEAAVGKKVTETCFYSIRLGKAVNCPL